VPIGPGSKIPPSPATIKSTPTSLGSTPIRSVSSLFHAGTILFAPLAAGLFAYYMKIGLQPDSPVQNPEKLYKQRGFLAYMIVCTVTFVVLMFTSIPVLYRVFNVEPSGTGPLWTIGEQQR